MAVPSSIPTVLGTLAAFTTTALVAVHAILAHELTSSSSSTTRSIAIVSAALEGIVLITLSTHIYFHLRRRRSSTAVSEGEKQPSFSSSVSASKHGLWFGLTIFLCTVGAAVSAAALATLHKSVHSGQTQTIFGSSVTPFLAGAAVTLGITFSAQLLFLILALSVARASGADSSSSSPMTQPASLETGRVSATGGASGITSRSNSSGSNNNNASTRSASLSTRVKSVPYSQTSSPASDRKQKTKSASILSRGRSTRDAEAHLRTPPGSSGGRSDTMNSIRSSFSQVIRPITSKTRLISPSSVNSGILGHSDTSGSGTSSQRSSAWRPDSLAGSSTSPASTYASRDRDVRPSIEDFDSWDTSAVDPQNRLTVLESSVSPSAIAGRFLETIPASPTTSRSPSPGTPLDLEPPRSRQRRSRSYSPAASSMRSASGTRLRSQSQSQSPPPPGEAHIHPLFRSDSPTPPPAVSAGTVVTAAPPNASQMTVTDAQSLRTLSRMRSGSLPAVPSPLSRQGSFDDFGVRRNMTLAERPHTGTGGHDLREEDGDLDITHHDDDEDEADRRSRADSNTERKMTPPIPEWILSAGARTSLSGYQSRKVRVQDGAP